MLAVCVGEGRSFTSLVVCLRYSGKRLLQPKLLVLGQLWSKSGSAGPTVILLVQLWFCGPTLVLLVHL